MLADRLLPPTRPLPVVRWKPVSDSETRIAFAHITSMSFDIPFMTCRAVYETECAWEGSYRGYIGYFQNTPVCTAAIVVAAGAIGIYSVATLPGYRRRGFAESLLRSVLAQVSADMKLTRYVLQSTKAGYDLYRRMGFDTVGRFAVYLT
jgi:ribosomal protein S18 acetylase RimI-like enzyme